MSTQALLFQQSVNSAQIKYNFNKGKPNMAWVKYNICRLNTIVAPRDFSDLQLREALEENYVGEMSKSPNRPYWANLSIYQAREPSLVPARFLIDSPVSAENILCEAFVVIW